MKSPFLAPTIYCDTHSIYLEFPGKPGQVLKFPLTEGGLFKALKHVPRIDAVRGQLTGGQNIADKTLFKAPAKVTKIGPRRKELPGISDAQKAAALDLIRRKG